MRIGRKTLVATAAVMTALSLTSPALADDNPSASPSESIATVPPEQPAESDLVEGVSEATPPAPTEAPLPDDDLDAPTAKATATPDSQGCEQGWYYHATEKKKDYHKGVGAEQANHNGTSRTAKSTFISEVSGTVGIAFSGELKVTQKAVVTEVEEKFGVNVSASLTAKLGNTISVDTPAHTTTYGRYGVYRLKSYGYNQYVYVNCGKGSKHNVTVYTPHRTGWAIWEDKD